MLKSLFKRTRPQQQSSRYRGARARLLHVLKREIATLDELVTSAESSLQFASDNEASDSREDTTLITPEKYDECGLASVLLAANNYYHFIRMSGRIDKYHAILVEYLSPVGTKSTTFPSGCERIYDNIRNKSADSPMLAVYHTELLNQFTYLLSRI